MGYLLYSGSVVIMTKTWLGLPGCEVDGAFHVLYRALESLRLMYFKSPAESNDVPFMTLMIIPSACVMLMSIW